MSNPRLSEPTEVDPKELNLDKMNFKDKVTAFVIFFRRLYSLIGDQRPNAITIQKLTCGLNLDEDYLCYYCLIALFFKHRLQPLPFDFVDLPKLRKLLLLTVENPRSDDITTLLLPYNMFNIGGFFNVKEKFIEASLKIELVTFGIQVVQGYLKGSRIELLMLLKGLVKKGFSNPEIVRIVRSKNSSKLYARLQRGNLHPHSLSLNPSNENASTQRTDDGVSLISNIQPLIPQTESSSRKRKALEVEDIPSPKKKSFCVLL